MCVAAGPGPGPGAGPGSGSAPEAGWSLERRRDGGAGALGSKRILEGQASSLRSASSPGGQL